MNPLLIGPTRSVTRSHHASLWLVKTPDHGGHSRPGIHDDATGRSK
jgi:hypothetical protein